MLSADWSLRFQWREALVGANWPHIRIDSHLERLQASIIISTHGLRENLPSRRFSPFEEWQLRESEWLNHVPWPRLTRQMRNPSPNFFFAKNPGVNVDWRPNQRVTSETSMASFGDITGLPSGIHMAWSSLPSSDDLRSWATVCKPAMELIYAPNVQNILSNIRFEHGMQNVLINTVGLKHGTITEFPAWDGISLHSLGRPVPNQLGIAFGSSEAPSPLSCLHRRSTIRVSQDFPTTG